MWLATRAGADARRPVAAQHAELAVGGEVGGQGDEAHRGEDDAHVADDVVLAGEHPAELGVGAGAEHAGEDEHGDGGEGDEADEHAGLPQQRRSSSAVSRAIVRSRPSWVRPAGSGWGSSVVIAVTCSCR